MRAGFTDSSLRIDALARAAGVSRSHLYRLFRSEYGVSPKAYLRDLRLTLARRLLCEHAMSVAEVAYACGYADPLYFSAEFKREHGISPRDFSRISPDGSS